MRKAKSQDEVKQAKAQRSKELRDAFRQERDYRDERMVEAIAKREARELEAERQRVIAWYKQYEKNQERLCSYE